MKKLLKKNKGFTLIELIVVIAILAILAAILIPSITTYIAKATEGKDQANARSYYSALTLEVATDKDWVDGTYTGSAPSNAAMPANNPCGGAISFTVSSGSITAYSCKPSATSKTYTAPNFLGS